MDNVPTMVAHRFGRRYGPDSSAAALAVAARLPLGGFETDCCLTRDGAIVLLHEPRLEHATDLEGWVREADASAVVASRLRDADGELSGEHPLLLEDGLDRLGRLDGIVQLEVKAFADADLAGATAREVARRVDASGFPRDRVEVISFWPSAVTVAAEHGFATRLIVACAYTPAALAEWAVERRVSGVLLEAHYFAAEPLAHWRGAGLSVMSGVCNDAVLARTILPFAPDFIASDRPHELREELTGA